jgi:hypothetical protein
MASDATGRARGPSGAADPPPPDLAARRLPMLILDAGARLARIHRRDRHPLFFGPGAGKSPTYRFDAESGRFGVLYAASRPEGAFFETLLRTPGQRLINYTDIAARNVAVLELLRPFRLVEFTGLGLSMLGLDASIFTGPYAPCGLWADALFDHPERPDGLIYRSRHNPQETCFALFERDDAMLVLRNSRPLAEFSAEIGAILDAAGKAVVY